MTRNIVVTRDQIVAVRDTARGDQSLVDACNVALWDVDVTGVLDGCHTASGDRVRSVIIARIDAGELAPTDAQRAAESRWFRGPIGVV